MRLRQVLRLLTLDLSLKQIDVSAAPPFLKFTFSRDELIGLQESQNVIRDLLVKNFIRRRVMWKDFAKEVASDSAASLETARNGLDDDAITLRNARSASTAALGRVATNWATACDFTRKALLDDPTQRGVQEALAELRRRTYPLVYALIEFLPADDEVAVEAMRTWSGGMALLSADAVIQRAVIPTWEARMGDGAAV